MKYNDISLNVLIKGKPITEYPHNSQVFIEGRDNSNFEIEVRNHNAHRVEAVIAVDGLSVIDGKDAGPASSGYVIEAHGSIRIPGWKLNDDQVAAFEFAGKRDSYSAAVNGGSARNTGVIGVLAYKEKPQRPVYVNTYASAFPGSYGAISKSVFRSASPTSASYGSGLETSRGISMNNMVSPGVCTSETDFTFMAGSNATSSVHAVAQLSAVEQSLGTAFGESQDFATTTVSFERGDLQAMIVMFYDDARGLKARGIDLSRRAKQRGTQSPVAFPGMTTGCQPPAGWRG